MALIRSPAAPLKEDATPEELMKDLAKRVKAKGKAKKKTKVKEREVAMEVD